MQSPYCIAKMRKTSGAQSPQGVQGVAPPSALLLQAPTPNAIQRAWVSYDGSITRLQVFVSNNGTKPSAPQLVASVNISQILGNNSAFVGFTAGSRCCEYVHLSPASVKGPRPSASCHSCPLLQSCNQCASAVHVCDAQSSTLVQQRCIWHLCYALRGGTSVQQGLSFPVLWLPPCPNSTCIQPRCTMRVFPTYL